MVFEQSSLRRKEEERYRRAPISAFARSWPFVRGVPITVSRAAVSAACCVPLPLDTPLDAQADAPPSSFARPFVLRRTADRRPQRVSPPLSASRPPPPADASRCVRNSPPAPSRVVCDSFRLSPPRALSAVNRLAISRGVHA